jgi:hypothetical protein
VPTKPLYKKKRVLIPAAALALLGGIGALGDDQQPADATPRQGLVSVPATTPSPSAVVAASAAAVQAAVEASAAAVEASASAAAAEASASASAAVEAERVVAEQAAQAKALLETQALAQAQAAADATAAQAAQAAREAAAAPAPRVSATKVPTSTYYANCTAVRAAGAAPIYAGQPGYSRKLDRDGDGVACE